MSSTVQYDDTQLQKLFSELSEKERAKALKGAFRAQARALRKAAVNNLRSSLNSNPELEKGVRALVFKRQLGFRVTVGTVLKWNKDHTGYATKKGFYMNRQGLEKPVLIWAEEGTKERRTKGQRAWYRTKRGQRRRRYMYNGAYRGRMRRYGFMEKARDQMAGTVTRELQDSIRTYVTKTAQKHGCKV